MIVDTSVILAILFKERHALWCVEHIDQSSSALGMSTMNLTEVLIRLKSRQPALYDALHAQLMTLPIQFIPISTVHAGIAADARLQYSLNMGDCFAYAVAKERRQPLLTLDSDFLKTDLEVIHPSR